MPDETPPPPSPDWAARSADVLKTEHFNLQSARTATIVESTGRASMYLATVSSALVALGFAGQSEGLGSLAFVVFALVLLPTIFFLGLVTMTRVTQCGVENLIYGRGINRIRRFYLEYAPEATSYFILGTHDDAKGVARNMGIVSGKRQVVFTVGSTIGVVNSVIAGAFFGLLASLFGPPLAVGVVVGTLAFGLSVAAHLWLEDSIYAGSAGDPTVQSPSPHDAPDATSD